MPRTKRPLEDDLIGLHERLTEWRGSHRSRSPLPEELWREATILAGRYGVHRTARALPIDYQLLQQRVGGATRPKRVATPKFVEVAVSMAAPRPISSECVMEWQASGGGGKLRLELKAMPVEEIAKLARALTAAASI